MNNPPALKAPILWQFIHWIINPLNYLEQCARKYGDVFTIPLGNNFTPLICLSDPQALEIILSRDCQELSTPGDANEFTEPVLGSQSLVTLSGAPHQRQRQLMMPYFHGERMKTYGDEIMSITKNVIREWSGHQAIAVRPAMQKISLRVILGIVFGVTKGSRYHQLETLLTQMLDAFSHRLGIAMLYFPFLSSLGGSVGPWQKFLDQKVQVDKLIYEEIRERHLHRDSSRTDILHLLMETRDEQGEPLCDEELHDELMALLVAGREAVATAMSWTFYWTAQNPEIKAQLMGELSVWQANPDPIKAFKLPYLTAICNETLRIYPPGLLTFPRRVETPIEIGGYWFQPGTLLTGCIYLAHRREVTYPHPQKFSPQRFLNHKFSPYEFLPFGGGSRRCIGQAFAQFEMKVVLATIMSQIEYELVNVRPVQPIRSGVTVAPEPIWIKITECKQA